MQDRVFLQDGDEGVEDARVANDAGFDGVQHNDTALHPGEAGQEHLFLGGLWEEVFAGHVVEEVLDDHCKVVSVALERLGAG